MGITETLPGLVVAGDASAGAEPYEAIYRQAMDRIATLDRTWQDAVRDVGVVPAPAVPVVAPVVAPVVVPAPAEQAPELSALPAPAATPPVPRPPLTVPARITSIPGADTAEAVLARSEAPRWRRSLAS